MQSSLRLDSIFIIINLAVKFSSTQLFVCSMSTKEQRKKGVGWRMAQKHDQKRTIWWQTLNTIYWTDLHSNSIPLNFLLSSVSVSFHVLPSFSTTHSVDDAPASTHQLLLLSRECLQSIVVASKLLSREYVDGTTIQ